MMTRQSFISLLACAALFACTVTELSARDTASQERFERRTVLYRGEKTVGASIMSANVTSANSEALLVVGDLDVTGKFFRIAPSFECAYRDNASMGIRLSYLRAALDLSSVDLSLFSSDLSFSLDDAVGTLNSFKAVVFHRNYIGLSKKGSVGLFLEEGLSYTHATTDLGTGDSATRDVRQRFMLSLSPGVILYILPFVSIDASIGIADLAFVTSSASKNGQTDGSRWQFKAGFKLDVLNLNFGIHYHF
ncbi:MAG: hypothetical protein MJY49_01295 [Bacteroidales bacterium]|nr:hypothetical protein [Bacteroidales bacterium]